MEPFQPDLFCDINANLIPIYYRFSCASITREQTLRELEKLIKAHPKIRRKKDGTKSYVLPRQKILLADFTEGYAINWAFQLHSVFASSLDIREKFLSESEEKKGVKPYKNQGTLFYFKQGQMIYDSILAYSDKPWSECIKNVKLAIKIKSSGPVCLIEPGNRRNPGFVAGQLFQNINDKLVLKKDFSMTQDEFVRALIRGFEED